MKKKKKKKKKDNENNVLTLSKRYGIVSQKREVAETRFCLVM